MCAALAGPLSLLNVSFQASVEFLACSVAVAVKTPPAPAFAPVGFGTSWPADIVALYEYLPASAAASATAVTTSAAAVASRIVSSLPMV